MAYMVRIAANVVARTHDSFLSTIRFHSHQFSDPAITPQHTGRLSCKCDNYHGPKIQKEESDNLTS